MKPGRFTPAAPPPFMVRLSAKHLARGRRFGGECSRPDREPLAPLARGTKVDMDEPRARVEAEAEEPDLPRRGLEATGSWFAMAMSNAAPSICFERVAPPTARLCEECIPRCGDHAQLCPFACRPPV